MARRVAPQIEMFGVAASKGPVTCANGLTVMADHGYAGCPPADILIVTGGPGWGAAREHAPTLEFIRRFAAKGTVSAICTGAMIVAASGLLQGRMATTKREVIGAEEPPVAILRREGKAGGVLEATVVDDEVITSGGVSLGIDGVLYLLERCLGGDVARETARILEYQAASAANQVRLPRVRIGAAA
jgi:transcriptional regulator GlxA family with amidase domain